MGPHEEWEAGPGGFLEGVALALMMGGSLKAPGRGGAGSRTWFVRAGLESGAQLSSASLGDSQGAGSAGTAHGGCQAQTWSLGRLKPHGTLARVRSHQVTFRGGSNKGAS